MKKLVSVAMSLVAGLALAETAVESANIVGYQDFNGTGSFTLAVPTFLPVGTDGSTMKLGDLMANEDFAAGYDAIKLYNGGTLIKTVTFYPYDDPDDYDIPGGWYEKTDFNESDEPTLLNDTSLPYGIGFVFDRANSNAAVKFVGEVKESDTTLPSTGSFTLCGNTTPVDYTLADFEGNESFKAGYDAIKLYNGGTLDKTVTFYPYDDPDDYDIPGGWYEKTDFNESDEPTLLNDTPIPAGRGFAFDRANANARVVVKNPLSEPVTK